MSDDTPKGGPNAPKLVDLPPKSPGRRVTTPTERGDTDLEGSASSLARQNLPREPNRGQWREEKSKDSSRSEEPGLRGVDDKH